MYKLILESENKINTNIALGGRNPFRACFYKNPSNIGSLFGL